MLKYYNASSSGIVSSCKLVVHWAVVAVVFLGAARQNGYFLLFCYSTAPTKDPFKFLLFHEIISQWILVESSFIPSISHFLFSFILFSRYFIPLSSCTKYGSLRTQFLYSKVPNSTSFLPTGKWASSTCHIADK